MRRPFCILFQDEETSRLGSSLTTPTKLRPILSKVTACLVRLAAAISGSSIKDCSVDQDFGHLWPRGHGENDLCSCGLVKGSDLDPAKPVVDLLEVVNSGADPALSGSELSICGELAGDRGLILDSASLKPALASIALETARSLASVGLVVRK